MPAGTAFWQQLYYLQAMLRTVPEGSSHPASLKCTSESTNRRLLCSCSLASQHYQPARESPHVGTACSAFKLRCTIHKIKTFMACNSSVAVRSWLSLLFPRQIKSAASCLIASPGFLRCSPTSSPALRRRGSSNFESRTSYRLPHLAYDQRGTRTKPSTICLLGFYLMSEEQRSQTGYCFAGHRGKVDKTVKIYT